MPENKVEPISGFEDKIDLDLKILRFLSAKLSEVFQSYGLAEIETPIIERDCTFGNIDLDSQREKEMFVFNVDNYLNGQKVESVKSILRPEGTAPTCRLYAKKRIQEGIELPFNVFYIAPMFRNEDLSDFVDGRTKRMFYQAGVELIGPSSTFADALVCDIAAKSLENVGFGKSLHCRISDIRLFEGLMDECERHLLSIVRPEKSDKTGNYFVDSPHREFKDSSGRRLTFTKAVKNGIDGISTSRAKQDKALTEVESQRLSYILGEMPLTEQLIRDVHMVSKLSGDKSMLTELESNLSVAENPKVKQAITNLRELSDYLTGMGVPYLIDVGVVRGLDIYSGGMVMQIDANLSRKAEAEVGGGGRYNDLIRKTLEDCLGEKDFTVPATGFAFGLDRLVNVVKEHSLFDGNLRSQVTFHVDKKSADLVIHSEDSLIAYKEAARIRKETGQRVEVDLMKRSKTELKQYAERKGILFIIV